MTRFGIPEGELCLDTCNALHARSTRSVTLTVTGDTVPSANGGRLMPYLDRMVRLLNLARSRGDRVSVILLQQRIRAELAR